MTATPRRRLLRLAGAALLTSAPGWGHAQTLTPAPTPATPPAPARPPWQRLAVADPPFLERYEAVVAMAPPLARNRIGRLLNQAANRALEDEKSDRLTAALDPEKTQLHEHFVQALGGHLADAGLTTLAVPTEAADSEAEVLAQLRRQAPEADALMLANVTGRFVALHGLQAYVPALTVGCLVLPAQPGATPWLDQVFGAGFRSLDPRIDHLADIALPERFDNLDALLAQADVARAALVRGSEALAAVVAQRLLGTKNS